MVESITVMNSEHQTIIYVWTWVLIRPPTLLIWSSKSTRQCLIRFTLWDKKCSLFQFWLDFSDIFYLICVLALAPIMPIANTSVGHGEAWAQSDQGL